MRKIMVIQHVAHEILGTLNPLLKKHGFRLRYVNFERHPDMKPSFNAYSGLVILGGPMGAYEYDTYGHLKEELRLIDEALKKEVPILGICLGAQLLAHALGACVQKHPMHEAGWHKVFLTNEGKADHLFSQYNASESVFQLHNDSFEIPKTATHLARSDLCEGQAFRYGKNAYGLQFHLEADESTVQRWVSLPTIRRQFFQGSESTGNQILRDTQVFMNRSLQLSNSTFTKFIELFNLRKKTYHLVQAMVKHSEAEPTSIKV